MTPDPTCSFERYKSGITNMGVRSARLQQLRPVTFHLRTDAGGAVQYGLIAEEVAKVYPELVIRGAGGRIDGVRYDELAPMLLDEMQQQRREQAAEVGALKKQLMAQASQLAEVQRLLVAITTQTKASQVVMS